MGLTGIILGILAGLIVGFFIGRITLKGAGRHQLEQELEHTRTALQQYEREVEQHLANSSQLFNQMTDNYQALHQHLERGINQLLAKKGPVARPDLQPHLSPLGSSEPTPAKLSGPKDKSDAAVTEPPRDYAASPSLLDLDDFSDRKNR